MIDPKELEKLFSYGDEVIRYYERGMTGEPPKQPEISYERYQPPKDWHKTDWAHRLLARIKAQEAI